MRCTIAHCPLLWPRALRSGSLYRSNVLSTWPLRTLFEFSNRPWSINTLERQAQLQFQHTNTGSLRNGSIGCPAINSKSCVQFACSPSHHPPARALAPTPLVPAQPESRRVCHAAPNSRASQRGQRHRAHI